jgi:hypothetical protein
LQDCLNEPAKGLLCGKWNKRRSLVDRNQLASIRFTDRYFKKAALPCQVASENSALLLDDHDYSVDKATFIAFHSMVSIYEGYMNI